MGFPAASHRPAGGASTALTSIQQQQSRIAGQTSSSVSPAVMRTSAQQLSRQSTPTTVVATPNTAAPQQAVDSSELRAGFQNSHSRSSAPTRATTIHNRTSDGLLGCGRDIRIPTVSSANVANSATATTNRPITDEHSTAATHSGDQSAIAAVAAATSVLVDECIGLVITAFYLFL